MYFSTVDRGLHTICKRSVSSVKKARLVLTLKRINSTQNVITETPELGQVLYSLCYKRTY